MHVRYLRMRSYKLDQMLEQESSERKMIKGTKRTFIQVTNGRNVNLTLQKPLISYYFTKDLTTHYTPPMIEISSKNVRSTQVL